MTGIPGGVLSCDLWDVILLWVDTSSLSGMSEKG